VLGGPVACHTRPCDARGVSSDGPSIPPARPTQFVVGEDERGNPKLDMVEGTFEQTYRVGEHHSVALFLALSRKRGLLPYRRARQHEGTVCVRATLSEHDALWSEFLELDRRLSARLAEVTRLFLREHVETKPR
jgi:hypothetical protein